MKNVFIMIFFILAPDNFVRNKILNYAVWYIHMHLTNPQHHVQQICNMLLKTDCKHYIKF